MDQHTDPHLAVAFSRFAQSRQASDVQRAVAGLAKAGDLTPEKVRATLSEADLAGARGDLIDIVLYYVRVALADNDLTERELATVTYLKRLFRIPEGAIVAHDRDDVAELLTSQVVRILADQNVDPAEAVQKVRLQEAFGLGYDEFLDFTRPVVRSIVRGWFDDPHDEYIGDLEARLARLDTVYSVGTVVDEMSQEALDFIDSLAGGGERDRQIPQDVKDRVWRRDQGRCVQCGSRDRLEFDHIIPFAKGGANTYRNVQLLCEACNREKSDNLG